MNSPPGVVIKGNIGGDMQHSCTQVLTYEALEFLADIHRRFNYSRLELLKKREIRRQHAVSASHYPTVNSDQSWTVAAVPGDMQKRHVEIAAPVDRKMIIKALNSGADTLMADFEDSLSPTWKNIVQGHANLIDAEEGSISFQNDDGSVRKLNKNVACLIVRPRGWHLEEQHIECDGLPMAASLVDFGIYFYHNIRMRVARDSSTYFYLPKMESHHECRLWKQVFQAAEDYMDIPEGSIRATIIIETLPAAINMEAMIYELKEYCCGATAGRWDYVFSIIKCFQGESKAVLPDRKQVSMTLPFMRAYTERLVKICHKHGAHAIGGNSAFIPTKTDEKINERAISQVRLDKEREVADGFDGTWVAHPDLVHVAQEAFLAGMGNRLMREIQVEIDDLIAINVPGGKITKDGVRRNTRVALKYIDKWLQGTGAITDDYLVVATATAEISRGQLWQWLRHSVVLEDGQIFTATLYQAIRNEELQRLAGSGAARLKQAEKILDHLVLSEEMEEFLTSFAYVLLVDPQATLP